MWFKPKAALVLILAGVPLMACAPVRAEEKASILPLSGASQTSQRAQEPIGKTAYHFKVVDSVDGNSFCTVLTEYLNGLPSLSGRFLEIPLSTTNHRFTKPDWKSLDVFAHKDIVAWLHEFEQKQAMLMAREEINLSQFSPVIDDEAIKNEIQKLSAKLDVAHFDLDNNGEKEDVYRYFRAYSNQGNDAYGGWSYFAPSMQDHHVYFINKDLNTPRLETSGHNLHRPQVYEAFVYFGHTYLLKGPFYDVITVYQPVEADSDGIGISMIDPNSRDSKVCSIKAERRAK